MQTNLSHPDYENMDGVGIVIRRGPAFTEKFEEMSQFLAGLDLPRGVHAKLLRSIVDVVCVAEKLALIQGIGMAVAPELYQDVYQIIQPKS